MADWVQKMKDTMQPHVPEPVTAVGILQPSDTWGASAFTFARVPLLGRLKQRKANEAAGGLAEAPPSGLFDNVKMAMLALTADKLYAFSGKPKGHELEDR